MPWQEIVTMERWGLLRDVHTQPDSSDDDEVASPRRKEWRDKKKKDIASKKKNSSSDSTHISELECSSAISTDSAADDAQDASDCGRRNHPGDTEKVARLTNTDYRDALDYRLYHLDNSSTKYNQLMGRNIGHYAKKRSRCSYERTFLDPSDPLRCRVSCPT